MDYVTLLEVIQCWDDVATTPYNDRDYGDKRWDGIA